MKCVQSVYKNCKHDEIFVVVCSQETAKFACYADLQDEQDIACHFSLKLPVYVQFTSPIRRFMDIVIHRFVTAALDSEDSPYTPEEVSFMFTYLILSLIISAKLI